jgi:predicted dehydrogenase
MTSSSPLGVAVVGLGAFGLRYVRAFSAQPGVTVQWGCDPDVQRHTEARAAGARDCTTDLAAVLTDPTVDAVVIATPESAHASVAISALSAGRHVVVEKPLATTESDAQAMIGAARQADRLLLPAFLLRFDYRYAQLRDRLQHIAPLHNIYAYRNFDRSLFRTYSRTHSFVENAIHDIDLIRWYLDDEVVQAHGYCRNTLGLPNPDINWGVLEFSRGAIAVVQTSWLYPEQEHRNLQWNAGIQLMGEGGVLELANDQTGARGNTVGDGLVLFDQTAWAEIHGEPRGAFGAMIRHFVACLRGEADPVGASAQDALAATRIAGMLIESAAGREDLRD